MVTAGFLFVSGMTYETAPQPNYLLRELVPRQKLLANPRLSIINNISLIMEIFGRSYLKLIFNTVKSPPGPLA